MDLNLKKKNRGELKRKAKTERKEGDLHERYPNFLLLYTLVWLRRRRIHVFHKLINIAAFPTLTHSLLYLRFDFVFTCFTHLSVYNLRLVCL